jgi:release factor glutamine methyltransferase
MEENKFDLVLANLPYLTKKQLQEPSIKREPLNALYGGPDGLSFYKTLLKQIPSYLNKKYLVLLEIDPRQDPEIKHLATKYFPQAKIEIKKDLAGQARVLKIENN